MNLHERRNPSWMLSPLTVVFTVMLFHAQFGSAFRVSRTPVLALDPGHGGVTTGLHNEAYRPQFHFTPVKNWMNDPNGPIFYAGEYHLFY
jgi:hypothetical protein